VKDFLESGIGKVLLTFVLITLPVIPVWRAPAVPNPTYELTSIPLFRVLFIYWMAGVWYVVEWYSIVAFLAVMALIVFVWRGSGRKGK
jgi:hypothetical protein